jgi:hypothetical protein
VNVKTNFCKYCRFDLKQELSLPIKIRCAIRRKFGRLLNQKIVLTKPVLFAGIVAGVMDLELLVCCFVVGSYRRDYAVNISILVLGTSLGWILGMALSPYNVKEQGDFGAYLKAVSAFFSGYLVAKIDPLAKYLSPMFQSTPDQGFRIILFFAALIVSMGMTFVNRRYAERPIALGNDDSARDVEGTPTEFPPKV